MNDAQREAKMATAVPGRTDEPGGRTEDNAAVDAENDQHKSEFGTVCRTTGRTATRIGRLANYYR